MSINNMEVVDVDADEVDTPFTIEQKLIIAEGVEALKKKTTYSNTEFSDDERQFIWETARSEKSNTKVIEAFKRKFPGRKFPSQGTVSNARKLDSPVTTHQ